MLIFPPGQVYPYIGNPPNHPNWLLGADSSLCWPLATKTVALKNMEVIVYPNPANNNLEIAYQCNNGNGTFYLYNAVGVPVAQYVLPKGQLTKTISIADLPTGVYTYKVVFDACGTIFGKINIVH
jgi:DNA-binding beta-propeller fold protein YncE